MCPETPQKRDARLKNEIGMNLGNKFVLPLTCCCTRQGHPWLTIWTVVAVENPPKDDVISCRVCFVSGEIADPKLMKDR